MRDDQLCWFCMKACGGCEWSRSLRHTADQTVDLEGYIIECRIYEPDVRAVTDERRRLKKLGHSSF